jgi:hypothetical protein
MNFPTLVRFIDAVWVIGLAACVAALAIPAWIWFWLGFAIVAIGFGLGAFRRFTRGGTWQPAFLAEGGIILAVLLAAALTR